MITIEISQDLIDFVENFYKNLYSNRGSQFIHPLERLKNLRRNYIPSKKPKQRALLDKFITDFDEILKFTPTEQESYIKTLKTSKQLVLLYDPNKKTKGKKAKDKKTAFGKDIYDAFNYEEFRKSEAYKIIDKVKLKTCAYCNSQLCINVKTNDITKSRLQFDHFYPKDKYPFLSISFFNLIPSCANCNLTKSNSNLPLSKVFHLYHTTRGLNPFRFKLDKISVAKYILSKDKKDIEFKFQAKLANNLNFSEDHNKVFDIQSIYDTQKDLAEEIINKAYYYNKIYKTGLKKSFSKIFPDEALINRLLLGNYSNEKDIHLRPMSKFSQDIAKDMGLLKMIE